MLEPVSLSSRKFPASTFFLSVMLMCSILSGAVIFEIAGMMRMVRAGPCWIAEDDKWVRLRGAGAATPLPFRVPGIRP